jgi:hypothetical protein
MKSADVEQLVGILRDTLSQEKLRQLREKLAV